MTYNQERKALPAKEVGHTIALLQSSHDVLDKDFLSAVLSSEGLNPYQFPRECCAESYLIDSVDIEVKQQPLGGK